MGWFYILALMTALNRPQGKFIAVIGGFASRAQCEQSAKLFPPNQSDVRPNGLLSTTDLESMGHKEASLCYPGTPQQEKP